MNPNNSDYNPFSDPEQFRQFLVQFQLQNPNFQLPQNPNFQQPPNPNYQMPPSPQFQYQQQQQPQNFQGGFASFTQGGFQQTISQPFQEADLATQTQPDTDFVPETQRVQKKKKATGKGKQKEATGSGAGPMTPKIWTPEEETTLATVFIDLSEHKTKGSYFYHSFFIITYKKYLSYIFL